MGYSVYWNNGRWQGYGVPAYCDYPGCKEKIDRGMGYTHNDDKEDNNIFCCQKHQDISIDSFEVDTDREHPEWLNHILTDHSWKQWREDEPEIVEKYKLMLKEQSK